MGEAKKRKEEIKNLKEKGKDPRNVFFKEIKHLMMTTPQHLWDSTYAHYEGKDISVGLLAKYLAACDRWHELEECAGNGSPVSNWWNVLMNSIPYKVVHTDYGYGYGRDIIFAESNKNNHIVLRAFESVICITDNFDAVDERDVEATERKAMDFGRGEVTMVDGSTFVRYNDTPHAKVA